jgi:putative transposase
VELISRYIEPTEIPLKQWLSWLGLSGGRYYQWVARYGQHNRHNGAVPRQYWLLDWEREAIIGYAMDHPLEGYRGLTYMMLDSDVVACSPSSVYRVLKGAGLIRSKSVRATQKGQGF